MANGSNCSYLSEEDINQLSLARGVSAIVAFVCCCLTLLLILLHRAFKTTLQRLFLYVPASLTVHIAVSIMQIRSSPEEYCQTVGFLNQYTLHVTFLFMLGAILYLGHRVRKSDPNRRKQTQPTQPKKGRVYGEVIFVVFSVLFPLSYNWIPFVTDAYGGQPWCWFKIQECSTESAFFYTVVFVGFLPPIVTLNLSAVLAFAIVIAYCRLSFRFRKSKEVRNKLAHEALGPLIVVAILLMYLVYTYIFLIAASQLYVEGDDQDLYQVYPFGLLMANAIMLPLIQMVLPASFVVYLYSFKSEVRKAKEAVVSYLKSHSVTKEESGHPGVVVVRDGDETFLQSAHVELPSMTCYPHIHEFSDEFLSSSPMTPMYLSFQAPPVANSDVATL